MFAEISGSALLLVALACPISMGVMMWLMGRGMMGGHRQDTSSGAEASSLADLKSEQTRLASKIEQLENEPATAEQRDPTPA